MAGAGVSELQRGARGAETQTSKKGHLLADAEVSDGGEMNSCRKSCKLNLTAILGGVTLLPVRKTPRVMPPESQALQGERESPFPLLQPWALPLLPHGQGPTQSQLAKQNTVCRVPAPAPQSRGKMGGFEAKRR